MAEWLYESGIGEARAILVDDETILEAHLEPDDAGPLVGAVLTARLLRRVGTRAFAVANDGVELLVEPPPPVSEGAAFRAEITREPLPERDRVKRARARPTMAAARAGEALSNRVEASGHPVRHLSPHGDDLFERAGWSELLEAARAGRVLFSGGELHVSLTPAMTLVDVDGTLAPDALATAGATAAARAIRCFGIGGSIGIDLPTSSNKAARLAAAAAIDRELPQPFERTAVNGFGFVQIVRPRPRPSLLERVQGDPAGHAARALLRRAERSQLHGAAVLTAAPSVIARLGNRPDWLDRLGRSLGGPVALASDPALAMSAGHVASA